MKWSFKILCIFVLVAIPLVLAVSVLSEIHQGNSLDWGYFLPYYVLLTVISVCFLFEKIKRNPIKDILEGALVGGAISLVFVVIFVIKNFGLILSDGTAHWAYVEIPIFYIGYGLIILGGIVGMGYAVFMNHGR